MSLKITVDVSQAEAFMGKIGQKIASAISQALSETADQIRNTTQSLAPVRTGYLRSQINVEASADGLTAESNADYSSYVDEGTSRMSAEPFFMQPTTNILASLPEKISSAISEVTDKQ